MLVLSRKADEKIVFPGLGISLKVLRVKGNVVKLGVDAPKDVKILRDEVSPDEYPSSKTVTKQKKAQHDFLNRMNVITVSLELIFSLLKKNQIEEAQHHFQKLVAELGALEAVVSAPELISPTKPRSALLVEDDSNERELLAAYLRLSGFDVDAVNDGCDALSHLETRPLPDLVLLDMQMPRCDGAHTISIIRNDPALRDLTVYAISGTKPSDMGVETGESGVNRWFPKPLNPATLVTAIKNEFAPLQGAA